MPLPDRDRSSGSFYSGILPDGVKWLLIINVSIFLLMFFSWGTRFADPFRPLGLVPRMVVESFAIWQLFTYMFLHSPVDLSHILVNMLTLWWIGSALEQTWGKRRFLRYYLLCGVGAGVCVVLLNYAFKSPDVWTIGASGAIYGILLAFGVLYPNVTMLFMLIFPMKAKYMVMLLGAIAFLFTMRGPGGGVSHVAHLGGMLVGWLLLKSDRRIKTVDIIGTLNQHYKEWKLQRAKRKFQVYLRKKQGGPDRWVN
jgi:membrane associated rhomboid family serine protease